MADITPVITKERIHEMRDEIVALKATLEAHFGAGGDVHQVGTLETPGFMSSELYTKLLGLQAQLNAAKEVIAANDVPEDLMLYWYGDLSEVPYGYKLCTGSNDTLSFANYYIKPCVSDSSAGSVGGTDKLSSVPLPRHRHSFQNYVDCEVWKELAWAVDGNQYTKRKHVGNLRGSECGKSASAYPLYYSDTTSSVGTNSLPTVKVTPSYAALHVIRRDTTPIIYSPYGIGSISINISSVIPTGWLELNGDWVDAGYYSAVHRYASSSGLLITSAQYTSMLNSYGTVPFFVYDSTNNLLRLPLLRGVIKLRGLDQAEKTAAQSKGHHYHGMGPMWDNNGKWGRLAFSTSSYPSGATGYSWNGRGGHDYYDTPPTDGSIITSYEFAVGETGNGEICDSINVNLVIKAFHEEAAGIAEASSSITDYGFESIAVATAEIEELSSEATVTDNTLSNPDATGWNIEPGGRMFSWGEYTFTETGKVFIAYPVAFTEKVYNINVTNVSCGYTDVPVIDFDNTNLDGFYINVTTDMIGQKASYIAFGV